MKTLFIALKALSFMTGFVFLWGCVALRVRVWDRAWGVSLPAWTATPGILLIVTGGILALTCVGTFVVRGRGTPAPFDAPVEFVAVGPYKHVRNPMYLGGLTALLGFGLYEHSPSIMLFSLPWLFFAHLFVIFYEEPTLRRKFSATYEAYCKEVPRWIPKFNAVG